jgi:hypothetical protein
MLVSETAAIFRHSRLYELHALIGDTRDEVIRWTLWRIVSLLATFVARNLGMGFSIQAGYGRLKEGDLGSTAGGVPIVGAVPGKIIPVWALHLEAVKNGEASLDVFRIHVVPTQELDSPTLHEMTVLGRVCIRDKKNTKEYTL